MCVRKRYMRDVEDTGWPNGDWPSEGQLDDYEPFILLRWGHVASCGRVYEGEAPSKHHRRPYFLIKLTGMRMSHLMLANFMGSLLENVQRNTENREKMPHLQFEPQKFLYRWRIFVKALWHSRTRRLSFIQRRCRKHKHQQWLTRRATFSVFIP